MLVQACYTAADNEAICLKLIDGGANPDSTFEAKMETALHASAASGSAQVNRHTTQIEAREKCLYLGFILDDKSNFIFIFSVSLFMF